MLRPSRVSRRRLLAGVGAGLALLAGCSAPQSSPATEATPSPATETPPEATGSGEAMPSPAEVDAQTETFVTRLADEEFEWAAGMVKSVLISEATGRLAATWRGLTIQHGPFEGFEIVGREVTDGNALRSVRLDFETGRQRLSLAFDTYTNVVGLDFPTRAVLPETDPPTSFDISLDRPGDDGCSLGATVTLPSGDDPVPGVVIVHRTGPLDRDGSVGPNRPYRDLAWLLAERGVATLRYDKRSFVCDLAKGDQTLDNLLVADAVTAAERLAATARISDVFVFGHGIGGVVAPLVARETDVAGLVFAATPTRKLTDVFRETERQKAAADGRITLDEQQRLDFFSEKLNQTSTLDDEDDYYILGTATRFWRDVTDHDVVAAFRDRPEPALALHAGRSFVTTDADRETWAGLTDEVRVYPDLDHLFMPVFGDSLPEAYFFPDTVSSAVADDVAAWLAAST